MPHSTTASVSSDRTFTLDDNNNNSSSNGPPNGHRSSGSFGVAVTSSPPSPVEDKSRLSFGLHNKRESTSVDDAYASLVGQNRNHVSADLSKPNGEAPAAPAPSTTPTPPYDRWSRRRSQSQHFDEPPVVTTHKDTFSNSIRDKVLRNSPVIAELKTNVIIKDEFTLVTDLSYHLAQRYSRPESCVMIKVDHSACLALGGGFEPCYILNINTIPSQLGAWSNRRNAALIQTFMAEILSVPAHRGVIKFEAVAEDCYAMNGITVQGELEKIERQQQQQQLAAQQEARHSTGSNPHRKSMSSFNVRRSEINPKRTISGAENTEPVSPLWSSEGGPVRPSTSHGFSASNPNAPFDGLRMNGVSMEQFMSKNAASINSNHIRPKTLGASPSGSADFTRTEAALTVPARGSSQSQSQQQPVLKSSFKSGFSSASRPGTSKSTTTSKTNSNATTNPSFISTTNNPSDLQARPRTTHLDDITALSRKFEQNPNPNNTTKSNPTALPDDLSTAANTAKRRATLSSSTANNTSSLITATTKGGEEAGSAPSPYVKTSHLNGSTTGLDRVSNFNTSNSLPANSTSNSNSSISNNSNNKNSSSRFASSRRSREEYLDQSKKSSSIDSWSVVSGNGKAYGISPPPIPADGKGGVNGSAASVKGETRSIRSFRLGQRRSAILNAFRRGMGREEKA